MEIKFDYYPRAYGYGTGASGSMRVNLDAALAETSGSFPIPHFRGVLKVLRDNTDELVRDQVKADLMRWILDKEKSVRRNPKVSKRLASMRRAFEAVFGKIEEEPCAQE